MDVYETVLRRGRRLGQAQARQGNHGIERLQSHASYSFHQWLILILGRSIQNTHLFAFLKLDSGLHCLTNRWRWARIVRKTFPRVGLCAAGSAFHAWKIVGSIPTRSTIFSTTCRYPAFQLVAFGSKTLVSRVTLQIRKSRSSALMRRLLLHAFGILPACKRQLSLPCGSV